MIRTLCLIICMFIAGYANAMPFKLPMNTQQLAKIETAMWRAYYERDFIRLSHRLYLLFAEEFPLSKSATVKAAYHATLAAKAMRKLPSDSERSAYEKRIIPHLTNFFKVLKREIKGNFDPKEAAHAELAWWVTRRTRERNDIKKIGRQISRVYVILLGVDNEEIQRAGYLRARAAWLRDNQFNQKGKVDWKIIENLLRQSYEKLKTGIIKSTKSVAYTKKLKTISAATMLPTMA